MQNEEVTEELVEQEEKIEESVEPEEDKKAEEPAEQEEDEKAEEPAEQEEEKKTEEPAEQEEKKEETAAKQERRKRIRKVFGKIGLFGVVPVVVSLLIVYIVGAFFYWDRLFMRTTVNHTNCSNMTMEQVEEKLNKSTNDYELKIVRSDGKEEVIKGTDIGLSYISAKELDRIFEKQNPFLWPKAMFEETKALGKLNLQYDKDGLRVLIEALDCMQEEHQKGPVAATIEYKDGAFEICEEIYGTEMDVEKFVRTVNERIQELRRDLDLTETKCYVQPKFLKDSQKVLDTQKEMNQYLETQITFEKDLAKVVLAPKDFATWIYADEEMNPQIDEEKIRAYVPGLSQAFNTPNGSRDLTTPDGEKTVTVPNAALGREVDKEGEVIKIKEDIKSGEKIVRSPLFSRLATAEGEYLWGNTYVEVDITLQYMWYVADGVVRMETPVVTGMKGKMDTPTGVFKIIEKRRNKTLVGQMVNGRPLYRQPVSYWMRITWSGVGFHDASWQASFGGDRYLTHGSHGCINMPWGKAKELYNMLPYDTAVVIHY